MRTFSDMGEGVYVKFVRRAQVVSGISYYLVPVEKAITARSCPSTEEVFLVEASSEGAQSDGGLTASSIADGQMFDSRWSHGSATLSGIVPDGVAKISLHYAATPLGRHAATVTATPVENVFVVSIPRAIINAALPTTIVWRSAEGSIIRTIHPRK
jgi:hypothetical protein